MKLVKAIGATSEIWQIFIRDSSSATGAGLTGLTNASSSLTAYYHRDTDTTATAISLVSMTVGTFTSSGFKEIDATNMPGFYQFCPPNAALASGAKSCGFLLKGATNMAPLPIEVQLTAGFSFDDAVRAGLTALPNAAAEAAGGLYTRGTGAGQINQPANGVVRVRRRYRNGNVGTEAWGGPHGSGERTPRRPTSPRLGEGYDSSANHLLRVAELSLYPPELVIHHHFTAPGIPACASPQTPAGLRPHPRSA